MGIENVEAVIIQALGHSERRNILKIINVQENGPCTAICSASWAYPQAR
jgi:hypothetical protein